MGMQVFNPNDGPFYLSDGSVVDGHGWATVEPDAKVDKALSSGRLVASAATVVAATVPEVKTPRKKKDDAEETAPAPDTLNAASDDEPKE